MNAFGFGFVENAGNSVAIGVDDVGGVGREKARYSEVFVGGGSIVAAVGGMRDSGWLCGGSDDMAVVGEANEAVEQR